MEYKEPERPMGIAAEEWSPHGSTQVILKNDPVRRLLVDLRLAWSSVGRPRFSFPRTIEMLCYLAVEANHTEEGLQKAYDQLKSNPPGRPKIKVKSRAEQYRSNTLVRCKCCSKELEFSDSSTATTAVGKLTACSAECVEKLEVEYGEDW